MKHSLLILGLASLAILSGCGDSKSTYKPVEAKTIEPASVAAGQEGTLFPMTVGNTWRYDVSMAQLMPNGQTSSQKADFVLEVKKADPTADGSGVRSEIDVSRGEVLQDHQTWRLDKTGIYQEEIGLETKKKFENQPAMVFPIEIGKPFEWSGTAPGPDGKSRPMKTTVECKGIEEVDSMIGTVSAYRVETIQRFKSDPDKKTGKTADIEALSVVYWAPKIGLVRQRQEVKMGTITLQTQLMVLKQYTVK